MFSYTTKAAMAAVMFAGATEAMTIWTGGSRDGEQMWAGCRMYGITDSEASAETRKQRFSSGVAIATQTGHDGDITIDSSLKRLKRDDGAVDLELKANLVIETDAADGGINESTCVAGASATTEELQAATATTFTPATRRNQGVYKVDDATVANADASLQEAFDINIRGELGYWIQITDASDVPIACCRLESWTKVSYDRKITRWGL